MKEQIIIWKQKYQTRIKGIRVLGLKKKKSNFTRKFLKEKAMQRKQRIEDLEKEIKDIENMLV